MTRILLISNSTVHGRGYLDHVEEEIEDFLGRVRTVLFFPFALYDHDDYAAKAKARFVAMGYSLESAHATDNLQKAIDRAEAIFIGGMRPGHKRPAHLRAVPARLNSQAGRFRGVDVAR